MKFDALLGEKKAQKFMRTAWRHTWFHERITKTALEEFAAQLPLSKPWEIAAMPGASGYTWGNTSPDGFEVNPYSAKIVYDQGMMLSTIVPRRAMPKLHVVLSEWEQLLGVPKNSGLIVVIAGKAGANILPHYDGTDNFTFGLAGKEQWQIAKNDHVQDPIAHFSWNEAEPPDLWRYADQPMPKKLPQHAETITVSTGDLLYFPAGHWHAIDVKQASLTLNLKFPTICWADEVTASLRRHLLRKPEWRRPVDGSPDTMHKLVDMLREDVAQLGEADYLPPTQISKIPADAVLERASTARVVRVAEDGDQFVTLFMRWGETTTRFKLSKPIWPLIEKLATIEGPFKWKGFDKLGLPKPIVEQLLCMLVSAGWLSMRSAEER